MRNSPRAKHIGAEPSQQPPDWWNNSSPCCAFRRSISSSAAGVADTRVGVVMRKTSVLERQRDHPAAAVDPALPVHSRRPLRGGAAQPQRGWSTEPERVRAVRDEQVLGLLVVLQHHLVVLAADARLLVAAEGGMRGIGVVAVGPHAAGL